MHGTKLHGWTGRRRDDVLFGKREKNGTRPRVIFMTDSGDYGIVIRPRGAERGQIRSYDAKHANVRQGS